MDGSAGQDCAIFNISLGMLNEQVLWNKRLKERNKNSSWEFGVGSSCQKEKKKKLITARRIHSNKYKKLEEC